MSTHLQRHHPLEAIQGSKKLAPPCTPKRNGSSATGQLRLPEVFKATQPLGPTSVRASAITRQVGIFIAKDMRPYSVVENHGFISLMRVCEPRYIVPSRTHFAQKVIPHLHEATLTRVARDLLEAESVACTTDGWTSCATVSYITITAQYIDSQWNMKNLVLQTRPLAEVHAGKNIGQILTNAQKEWKIERPHDICPLVTDNASNMDIAPKEANMSPHIKCFAHTINLAAQRGTGVPQVARLLGRIRRIAAFFHSSSAAAAILKAKQQLLQLPQHRLVIDVQTRWNSSFDMVARNLEQQAAVISTLMTKEVRKNVKDLVTLSDQGHYTCRRTDKGVRATEDHHHPSVQ